MGTVGYMSPEQAAGRPLDFRSDQFSFGSILYEMATGKRAFERGTTAETLTAIIREEPVPVVQMNPRCRRRCAGSSSGASRRTRRTASARRRTSRATSPTCATTSPRRRSPRPTTSRAIAAAAVRADGGGSGRPLGARARGRRGRGRVPRRPARGAGHAAAVVSPAHVSARRDLRGAIRARRPDDPLLGVVGGPAGRDLRLATRQPGVAALRPEVGRPARDLALRRDGVSLDRRFAGAFQRTGTLARIGLTGRRNAPRGPGGRAVGGLVAGRAGRSPSCAPSGRRCSSSIRSARSSSTRPAGSPIRGSRPRAICRLSAPSGQGDDGGTVDVVDAAGADHKLAERLLDGGRPRLVARRRRSGSRRRSPAATARSTP